MHLSLIATIITLMVRLKSPAVLLALAALLALAGFQLYYLSRTSPEAQHPRRFFRPRLPVHLAIDREEPVVVETLEAVDGLRDYFKDPEHQVGGVGPNSDLHQKCLRTLRRTGVAKLYYLEQIILDASEHLSLRVELLKLVAENREEATRIFIAGLFVEPGEDHAIRLVALHELEAYPGDATFEQFRQVYNLEPEFPGRGLIVNAMGHTQSDEAIPFLRDRVRPTEPLDVRCLAASALGNFADKPGVFETLKGLVLADKVRDVRRNALNEIGKRPGPDADEVLHKVADKPGEDAVLRQTARAWLDRRKGGK